VLSTRALAVAIPIKNCPIDKRLEPLDARDQNRNLGDEQLDDGIGDTLVSALLQEVLTTLLHTYRLDLRTERDKDDRVGLTVKDAEAGFASHVADRPLQIVLHQQNDGVGIGLSVDRSIIDAHQERFWAALNDRPGCTFSLAST
jgi:hypothetical protein